MIQKIIELMIEQNVLSFGDFTLKSGRKAPYFMNFGNIRNGKALSLIGELFADLYLEKIGRSTILFGPAYKGIPLSVAMATSVYDKSGLSLPVCYNRKERKDHGEGGIMVGHIPSAGDQVTIVEDVITAGTAVRQSIQVIEKTGARVESLIVAVDRMERGKTGKSTTEELAAEFGIKVFSLISIKEIVQNLELDEHTMGAIRMYLKKYGSNSAIF